MVIFTTDSMPLTEADGLTILCVRRVSREIQLNIEGVDIGDIGDIRNSSKLKNIDKTYIRVRLWL